MNRNDAEKIRYQVVVVSDVHLRDEKDERHQKLVSLIRALEPQRVRFFVLLGDIFDFCFGAGPYFRQKFTTLGQELSLLAEAGVRVIFVQGNHEFSLNHLHWPGVEFVTRRELTIGVGEDCTISFSHGDRLRAPWHYHLYSALSRSFLFRLGGLLVPPLFLDEACLKISGKSRKSSAEKRINHAAILAAIQAWISSLGGNQRVRHGVVGHFHCPYDVKRKDGVEGRLLCLKSWDQPNFLAFHDGIFFRYEYQKATESFRPVSGPASETF